MMNQSIEIMKNRIVNILLENRPSIYLYGSIVLDDFKLGWSNIDIICLTENPITYGQAKQLLYLRQELLKEYNDNLYFHLFEGGFLTLNTFINEIPDIVTYWGTSGQRITDKYNFDPFSMIELLHGYLLYGEDIRSKLSFPTKNDVIKAVKEHYNTIRKYAVTAKRSLYSAGWILDIARCIYTLRTGRIISKTKAGEWALEKNIVFNNEIMQKVIEIRKEPNKYKNDIKTMEWIETLGEYIQTFADVLENEILIAELGNC